MEIQATGNSITFSVYVQPRASKVAFAGCHLNALKIRLTAPPADGAANKQCIDLIAQTLSLPKSAVEICSGHTSRHKRIRIRLGNDCNSQIINELSQKISSLGG